MQVSSTTSTEFKVEMNENSSQTSVTNTGGHWGTEPFMPRALFYLDNREWFLNAKMFYSLFNNICSIPRAGCRNGQVKISILI